MTGEESREIPSIQPEDIPIRWSKDDRFLFVYRYGQVPVEVTKIDLSTGTRSVWKELGPDDPVGVASIDRVFLDAEGESYYYSYMRVLCDLYLAKVTR